MFETGQMYDSIQILENKDQPFERRERLKAVEKPLLSWYASRARSLPWRDNPEPYRVWISEIMLQQTRVEAVKPYFERFMKEFPTVGDLAVAGDDRLMKMWEGLGYYNRARNLKAAARILTEEYGGCLPASYDELIKLPGIGSYTAGAIASIAYNIPMPAVDGNVLRVASRILGDREDIKKTAVKSRMESELREIMPCQEASHYNQGLIELGALVCIPGGEPKCGECPAASLCLTAKNGWWREIPYKSPSKKRKIEERTVFIIEYEDKVAIRKRPAKGLLAALYEFPNIEGRPSEDEVGRVLGLGSAKIKDITPLPEAKHVFSHVEWHMRGYRVELAGLPDPAKEEEKTETGKMEVGEDRIPASWIMASKEDLAGMYAIPNAFGVYTKACLD